jgi:putative ABC transport system substrate-binding protein
LAAELVSLPVDVLLASNLRAIVAAKNATATIPIVMTNIGSDPVAVGLVDSLARPGGNVTGAANSGVLLVGKRVELLKQMLPALDRLAMFQEAGGNAGDVAAAQPVASTLGIQIQVLSVRSANDLDAAFEAAMREHAEALIVFGTTVFQINRTRIIALAAQHHVPAIYTQREWAAEGGLMAYAASFAASYRNAATFVSKILKGSKPADLPVEQPNVFDFVVNLKTAQALGLAIPQSVLQQATELIQ